MTAVALQQVSSDYAKANAKRTLERAIDLKYLLPDCNDKQRLEVTQHIRTPTVFVWGSKIERYHQQWKVRSRQCVMLFRRGTSVVKAGVVVVRIQNHVLAEKLWGTDREGETWDFIYLFEVLRDVMIRASEINAILGYQVNSHWQGLVIVDDDNSEAVVSLIKRKAEGAP